MRACIAGWGTALPEQRLTNAELEQRVDTTDQWIVERTGIRERRVAATGRDHRQPRHRGGRRRDQARRPHPRRDRPPRRRHRDPGAAHPAHGRVRRPTASASIAARSTSTPDAPGSSTSSSSARRCSPAATSSTCSSSAPRPSRASSTRSTAPPASCSVTAPPAFVLSASPDDGPGILVVGARLRRFGNRPPRAPRRRQPPARRPPETVANREHFIKMVGPGGVPAGGAHRHRVGHDRARPRRRHRRRPRLVRSPPGQRPHHRGRRRRASGSRRSARS